MLEGIAAVEGAVDRQENVAIDGASEPATKVWCTLVPPQFVFCACTCHDE